MKVCGILGVLWTLHFVTSEHPIEELIAHQGTKITLRCGFLKEGLFWIKNTKLGIKDSPDRVVTQDDGNLYISDLRRSLDSGNYTCRSEEKILKEIQLTVKSAPSKVTNLTVIPHSVYALITWAKPLDDGGYPISNYVLKYELEGSYLLDDVANDAIAGESGSHIISDISASSTSKEVYHLRPNSTYSFSLLAANHLGEGESSTIASDTKYSEEEIAQANQSFEESQRPNLYVKILLTVILVVLVAFGILGLGISLVVLRSCGQSVVRRPDLSCEANEEEAMELVPHITLNPSFNIDMLEYIEPTEVSPTLDLHGVLGRGHDCVTLVEDGRGISNG